MMPCVGRGGCHDNNTLVTSLDTMVTLLGDVGTNSNMYHTTNVMLVHFTPNGHLTLTLTLSNTVKALTYFKQQTKQVQ